MSNESARAADLLTSLDQAQREIDAGEYEEYTIETLPMLVASVRTRGMAKLLEQSPELRMAYKHYGYGRWNAPFWFIGPEQGQTRNGNDTLAQRIKAWQELGESELCDCRRFHELIHYPRWHGRPTKLQSTWKSLLLLLLAYLGIPTDDAQDENRRTYQRERWGRIENGETCVIELSGLPANNLKIQINRERFRSERVDAIRQRISQHTQFIVMYGVSEHKYWNSIANTALELNKPFKNESTVFLYTLHPNTRGLTKQYWVELGQTLRRYANSQAI